MTKKNIFRILKDWIYNLLFQGPRTLVFKKLFPIWQSLGFYLIPNHYYEPIPDTRSLNNNLWARQLSLKPIIFDIPGQLKLLDTLARKYKKEYKNFPLNSTNNPDQYYVNNGSFEVVDGEVFYSMIRYFKPKKIIEIGSGFSTLLAASALRRNKQEGQYSKLIVIDPYPAENIRAKFPEISNLITKKVQEIPASRFLQLGENDILFIDSSHMLKIGSDLYHIFLGILPNLKKGVIVHFHDIFLPKEYPKDHVLKRYYFYNEQYFLYTFLLFNNSFKVLLAANYMSSNYQQKLRKYFPSSSGRNLNPGSFWVQKIR